MTQHHKAKQREKLVKGYLTQMETQDQTEENNEKKKDHIQIFHYIYIYTYTYIYIYIYTYTYITTTNILRTSKFNATRKHMNLLMLYR